MCKCSLFYGFFSSFMLDNSLYSISSYMNFGSISAGSMQNRFSWKSSSSHPTTQFYGGS